jgi:hypothetical protein
MEHLAQYLFVGGLMRANVAFRLKTIDANVVCKFAQKVLRLLVYQPSRPFISGRSSMTPQI